MTSIMCPNRAIISLVLLVLFLLLCVWEYVYYFATDDHISLPKFIDE